MEKSEGPVQGAGFQVNIIFSGERRLDDRDLADQNVAELIPILQQLLEKVSSTRSLIHKVACRRGIQLEPGESDLKTLLEELNHFNVSREQFPLVLEVAELASKRAGDPALRAELALISDRWADQADDGRSRLAAVRGAHEPQESTQESPCLMIRLEREKNGDDRYWLSAGIFRGGDIVSKKEGTEYVALEKNHEYLNMIFPGLVETVDRSRLSVEFVVDRDLLNEEFDQWLVPEDTPSSLPDQVPPRPSDPGWYRIGVEYPVVIRDLQRMRKPSLHGWWKSRWQVLSDRSAGADAICWRWVDPGHDAVDKLRASLHLKEQMACLALMSAPCSGSLAARLLETGLAVGAPAAIWLRTSPEEEQARAYLAAVLDSQELRDLPARVLMLRREADADGSDNHHGHQLSLLWDDPNRVWEPVPLAEP